jgi:diguanylate cyclase (GGDEF)-like protein/PAS domain S-box-containing protein
MSIHTKLFFQTTLILLIVLILGGFFYLQDLKNTFKDHIQKTITYDSKKAKNYIEQKKSTLQTITQTIARNDNIQSSVNLISKYEQNNATNIDVFDTEKKLLLQFLDNWLHKDDNFSIEFYNPMGQLIAQKGFEVQNYDTGYVSKDKSGQTVFKNLQDQMMGLPINSFKKQHLNTLVFNEKNSRFSYEYIEAIKGFNDKIIGYIKASYWIEQSDILYLNENLINPTYLEYGQENIIAPPALNLEKIIKEQQYNIIQTILDQQNSITLYANYVIDNNFIQEQKNSIVLRLFYLALLLTLISYAVAWYFSKNLIIDPLNKLKDSIESIKNQEYQKIENIKDDELGRIINEFDYLFEMLSKSYASLESYKKAVDAANIVSSTDPSGKIITANQNFVDISGYSKNELIGSPHSIVRHPDMPKKVFKELWETIKKGEVWRGRVKNRIKNGGYYWTDAVISPILDSQGNIKEYISIRRDITEIIDQKNKLEHLANFDRLTKLGTRTKLNHDLKKLDNVSLAIMNLDRFSQINDFYGHEFGDCVLKEFAVKLQKCTSIFLHKDVEIYRQSGDEFVILDHHSSKEVFIEKVHQILKFIENNSLQIQDEQVDLNVSCGISFEEPNTTLLTADMALRISRKEKKDLVVYNPSNNLNHVYQKNIEWAKRLKLAINEDRLVPFFQPIVNNETLAYEKYESLVRIIDTDGKIISPFFFLDIAKQTKQYATLTKIMIEKSFETFANRSEEFSINLTVEDIVNKDLSDFISNLLDKYDNIGSRVVFEIVESESINNYQEVINFINHVKYRGCKIAIDDFGTGYSNFEYLIKLKADFIKIDGSLIKNILKDEASRVVVSVIVSFAKQMKIKTIAEFVEDNEILQELQKMGIDYSQGYHFSPPLQTI